MVPPGGAAAYEENGASMSRVSVTEQAKLSMFLARVILRALVGQFVAFWIYRLPLFSGKNDRLVIAPQDLRTADATQAAEIHSGRFVFAGKVAVCDGRSPFEISPPSEEWAIGLHGFSWLRHLRTSDPAISRARARSLVNEWLRKVSAGNPISRRPEVISRRIISWLTQAPLLIDDSDVRFYRRFIRSLNRQVRALRVTLAGPRDGVPRLQAVIALVYASLCMQGQARYIEGSTRQLAEELDRQILPDGGHIGRNPGSLIELLVDLLPLRQAFSSRNIPPPPSLLNAIDRMMPMLRFFRHGDGNFALFNGMGPTPTDLLTTVLAYDDARGTPVSNAPHAGYQRVEAGGTLILMDTGRPPQLAASQEAHASCLSFELSHRNFRILVNCGLPGTSREHWRPMARSTAANSTVTFNDVSSCRFMESRLIRRLMRGTPIVSGPRQVTVNRDEDESGATVLRVSHDGYVEEFGILHQRALMLSPDGKRLDGEELFTAMHGEALASQDQFAVRFHLHPMIKANRLSDSHGAMLLLPNKDVWTFNAYEDRIDIEESVYLAGTEGPRRTTQIVIHGRARKVARIQWTLSLTAVSPVGLARRGRGEIAPREKSEAKIEQKGDAKKVEQKVEQKAEPKPAPKVEQKPTPKAEQKPAPKVEPVSEQMSQPKPEPKKV
jgi:uncharacterized heparinase superfamily protein